jgi:lipopolysaccharide transport system ATP-binding protein
MPLSFRDAATAHLKPLVAALPGGVIVGVIGSDTAAITDLLRLASGELAPTAGTVESTEPRRFLGADSSFQLSPASVLALHHTFSQQPALVRGRAFIALERLRRAGATILIASHELDLLRELCDEIWWVEAGTLQAKGDPQEILTAYQTEVARQLRQWSASVQQALAPSMRRGDGRAELRAIELLDAAGHPASVWQAGEPAAIRVTVAFHEAVDAPVIGIMIRTRIGFEVYGTNTELEGLRLGPVARGQTLIVTFSFRCELCPRDYTVTAASHDPDGVWHDWLEDAIAVRVTDTRYTAGVANLRAQVAAKLT